MGNKVLNVDGLLSYIEQNSYEVEDPAPPPPPPPPPPPVGDFQLVWPTDYPVVTQPYAANPGYYGQFGLPGHEGLDIRAPMVANIYAAAAGEVYRVETNPGSGNYGIHIRIKHDHPSGVYRTIYAHLDTALVQVGEFVSAGKLIGKADNTGNSSGSHLHLTLKKDDQPSDAWMPHKIINPTVYFPALFPGEGWKVLVFGNFRTAPEVGDNKVDAGLQAGTEVDAVDFDGEWWKVRRRSNGAEGWFWNPGYKLRAL